jgi:shikimate kinase
MSVERPERVVLVGFMGVGKTTVGRELARRLRWRFVDMDERIEERLGCPIAEVFRTHGEARFRQEELAVATDLRAARSLVVAAGGGAFAQDETRQALARDAVVVWLRCDLDEIMRRVGAGALRPLASGREAMAQLLAQREASYRQAGLVVDTGVLGPEAAAATIARALPTSTREAATA